MATVAELKAVPKESRTIVDGAKLDKLTIDHNTETNESNSSSPAGESSPEVQYTTIQWLLIILAVYSSALFYGLDTTIVAVVQGPVTERFNEVEKIGWLGIGFPLGSISTIAAWSSAYGIFDAKWMFIGSLINFSAGSALCAAAPSMNALIVGRVWAGAGGAGMYLGQLNIWTRNTTTKTRSLYISGGGIVWGLGCIIGPVIGGAFADSAATWRWAFYINLILFGAFSPVYLFVLHPTLHEPPPVIARLKTLDWLGILLNAAMYTSFVLGLSIGGTVWPWKSGRTISCIVVFAVLLALLIIQQRLCILTTSANRIYPTEFLQFDRRSFILLYVAQVCVQTGLAIPIYYIPLTFQFTRGESAVGSATRLLPFLIINIVTVFANGALLPRFHYYVPWYIASSTFNIIGGALFFSLLSLKTSVGAIYGYSISLALGTGLAQQCSYSVASMKASKHVPAAIGFINSAQVGSVVVMLTFTSLIFQNVGFHEVKNAVAGLDFDDQEIRRALGGAASAILRDGQVNGGISRRIKEGILDAIRWSFLPVLVAGAVGLAASLGMRWERLFVGTQQNLKEKEKAPHVHQRVEIA